METQTITHLEDRRRAKRLAKPQPIRRVNAPRDHWRPARPPPPVKVVLRTSGRRPETVDLIVDVQAVASPHKRFRHAVPRTRPSPLMRVLADWGIDFALMFFIVACMVFFH